MASGYDDAAFYRQIDPEKAKAIRFLIQYLLKANGPVTVHGLASRHQWKEAGLIALIDSSPGNFERYQDGQHTYVKLVCSLSICKVHCVKNKSCSGFPPECSGLHICKFYILSDSCRFGQQCHFGHDLTTTHNISVLREFFLDGLQVDDVRNLMKQTENRTATTFPKICMFYNHQSGCRDTNRGKTCPFLHVCKYYLQNNCHFGKNCKRSHNILDPSVIAILNKHGIDTRKTPKEILMELREANEQVLGSDTSGSVDDMAINLGGLECTARVRRDSQGPALPSNPQANGSSAAEISLDQNSNQVICLYYLKGRCAYGQSCHNVHCEMPFQWLYRRSPSQNWQPVDPKQNMEIEMTYSDANNSEHVLLIQGESVWVTFKDMTGKDKHDTEYEIQRLSTPSSGEMANQTLATQWVWSYKNQTGQWKEYGDNNYGYSSNLRSADIEQAFLANPDGCLKFVTEGYEYELDLRRMVQQNLHYQTQREVRRRPTFVTAEEVAERKKQVVRNPKMGKKTTGTPSKQNHRTASVSLVTAPSHWEMMKEEDILDHYRLVQLSKRRQETQQEYKEVEALFSETMPSTATITSISRIQNGDLWTNYVNKRLKMEKKCKGPLEERRLFHETHSQYVEAICRQGFDFRLCGQSVGTAFGKGSYFATTAQYSDCYTSSQDRTLFVVKVLVGDFTTGKSDFVRPPPKSPKEPHSDLFDSCVDDVKSPKIFVIFDNNGQVYPEYVIKYGMKFTA